MGAVEQRITIPYAPRVHQLAIHQALEEKRFGVVVCHRRFGKTVMAVNHLIRAALTCTKDRPRFAYVAPTYRQGKAIAWDYLKHYADVVPGRVFNETELRVDIPNGAQIRIYGADNPDSLRGIYLDGAVLDEFGLMQGRVWSEVIRPALSDRMGWAAFLGTPNGKNAFWEMRDSAVGSDAWFLAEYRASSTGIIHPDELADARRQMTPDEYAQEFECSFEASVKGAIYATELAAAKEQGRVAKAIHDPALQVHTFWDIGVGDATSIWFAQQLRGEIRLVDYYETSGEAIAHYVQVLKSKPYTYGRHVLPHDAAARELGTGKSIEEMLRTLGVKVEIGPRLDIEERINAGRMIFTRCYFDADKCKAGLDALSNYRRDYNTRLGEFKASPVHDWSSHGADAFGYLALGIDKAERKAPKPTEYRPPTGWMG